MSIIKCPECGKEISSETKICLNCGYKIKKKRKKIKSIQQKNKMYKKGELGHRLSDML